MLTWSSELPSRRRGDPRLGQPAHAQKVGQIPTVWRLLDQVGEPELTALAAARAAVRQVAWAQGGELTGASVPTATAGGVDLSMVTRRTRVP